MSVPVLMVATVGLNPLPVVLAVLTRRPGQVILVHSDESAEVSARVAEVLGEVAPEVGVEQWNWGVVEDFSAVVALFDELPEQLREAGEYLLDYSGGNKFMTVGAVWLHLRDHGGGGEKWRSYVDNTTGRLVTGSAEVGALPVADSGLTLSRLAAMHGFFLDDVGVEWARAATVPIGEVHALIDAVDARPREFRKHFATLRDLMGRAGVGQGWEPAMVAAETVRGSARELLAVCRIAGLVGDGVEVLFSAAVKSDRSQQRHTGVAELDLVVRQGHRVLGIEVKSSVEQARKTLGQRTMFSRLVFGSATETAIAATAGTGEWDELETKRRQLTDAAPWLGKVSVWRLEDSPEKGIGFEDGVRGWLGEAEGVAETVGDAGPKVDADAVVVPGIGTRLAILAALGRAGDLATKTAGVGVGSLDSDEWFLDRCDELEVVVAEEVSVLRGFSEAATAEYVPEVAAAIITPGPKGVTAGLVRAVYAGDGVVGHVGLDGRLHTLSGVARPVGAQHATAGYTARWEQILGDRFSRTGRIGNARRPVRAAAEKLEEVLDCAEVEFWWPSEQRVRIDRDPRPELLVTGRFGCCSIHVLHVPEKDYPAPATREAQAVIDKKVKADRFGILSATAEAVNMVGDAHRPLVLLHNRAGATALGDWRTTPKAMLVGPPGKPRADGQWERFARVDRWLPIGLWSGIPDPFTLLIDRDAVLRHLDGHRGQAPVPAG